MKPGMFFENVTAIVLAGGKSLRMGADKCRLRIGDLSLLEYILKQLGSYFGEVLISSNELGRFDSLGFKVVVDEEEAKGPLMGIVSCICESKNDLNFVQACDIPHTDIELVARMLSLATDFDAVMPQTAQNHLEPLFAVYRKSALKHMRRILEFENGKPYLIRERCNTGLISLGSTERLENLNTIEDYSAFLQKHSSSLKRLFDAGR